MLSWCAHVQARVQDQEASKAILNIRRLIVIIGGIIAVAIGSAILIHSGGGRAGTGTGT